MSDGQLLTAYAQGDEQAFANLVRTYFPMVYSAAVRQVGDLHLAEEVAQSVFILLSKKAAKLAPAVSLTGWLLRTTRFVAKDALKQATRRMKRELEAAERALPEEAWGPEWTGATALVDEALLALAAPEQACVVARFFEGRSFREIGDQQCLSEDGAQKRVARALEKMRHYLQRRGVKVSAAAIPAILSVNFAQARPELFLQSAVESVQSALRNQSGSNVVNLANRTAQTLARRQMLFIGGQVITGLVLVGVVGLLVRDNLRPALPANPPFRIGDSRVETLGKAWSQVVRRAALLVTNPRARVGPGGAPSPEYRQEYNWVVAETVRISTELNAVIQPGDQRDLLAEFLTVELGAVLDLSATQKAAALALLRDELNTGTTLKDAMRSLVANKASVGATIQGWLSRRQQRRFLRYYGANYLNLFTFAAAAGG